MTYCCEECGNWVDPLWVDIHKKSHFRTWENAVVNDLAVNEWGEPL